MSPEVYVSRNDTELKMPYVSSANDVWALGVILINLLTGMNPWKEPSFKNALFSSYIQQTADKNSVFHLHTESSVISGSEKTSASLQKTFGFSRPICDILACVFNVDPFKRPSAHELGCLISQVDEFFEVDEIDSPVLVRRSNDVNTLQIPQLLSPSSDKTAGPTSGSPNLSMVCFTPQHSHNERSNSQPGTLYSSHVSSTFQGRVSGNGRAVEPKVASSPHDDVDSEAVQRYLSEGRIFSASAITECSDIEAFEDDQCEFNSHHMYNNGNTQVDVPDVKSETATDLLRISRKK